MGHYDPRGIYIFDETDQAAPFSDLLNLATESVSDEIANDRARLSALEGRGAASTWTPSFTNGTVAGGTVTAYWTRIGDLVAWQWKWVFSVSSTITGTFNSDLPTLILGGAWMTPGGGYVSRGASSPTTVECRMTGSTNFQLWSDNGSINATPPMGGNWISGDVISVGGVYFAA